MEQKEFENIYQTYYKRIYAYIRKRISQEQDCEELASDVFTSFYQKLNRYDAEKSSVATWLYVIASNRLKNYYRDKKEILSLDDEDIEWEMPAEQETPEVVQEKEQQREELLQALRQLPKRDRTVLILRFYQNLPAEEIAQRLGLSAGNVRIIQKRALEKLQNILQTLRGGALGD